ncbi:hypothetical protein Tcan_09999, partial [Toxocara canis]
ILKRLDGRRYVAQLLQAAKKREKPHRKGCYICDFAISLLELTDLISFKQRSINRNVIDDFDDANGHTNIT